MRGTTVVGGPPSRVRRGPAVDDPVSGGRRARARPCMIAVGGSADTGRDGRRIGRLRSGFSRLAARPARPGSPARVLRGLHLGRPDRNSTGSDHTRRRTAPRAAPPRRTRCTRCCVMPTPSHAAHWTAGMRRRAGCADMHTSCDLRASRRTHLFVGIFARSPSDAPGPQITPSLRVARDRRTRSVRGTPAAPARVSAWFSSARKCPAPGHAARDQPGLGGPRAPDVQRARPVAPDHPALPPQHQARRGDPVAGGGARRVVLEVDRRAGAVVLDHRVAGGGVGEHPLVLAQRLGVVRVEPAAPAAQRAVQEVPAGRRRSAAPAGRRGWMRKNQW